MRVDLKVSCIFRVVCKLIFRLTLCHLYAVDIVKSILHLCRYLDWRTEEYRVYQLEKVGVSRAIRAVANQKSKPEQCSAMWT